MKCYLNEIGFDVYGIVPGHAPGGNVCFSGLFNMPERIGKSYHEWADEDSVEPYVLSDEIQFGGRDITFYGSITGTAVQVRTYLSALYNAIDLFTDLVELETEYGTFNVYVKEVNPEYIGGGAKITILFREPVVSFAGGFIPDAGTSDYSINGIPLASYGLYYSKGRKLDDHPELKEQVFTLYGAEGYRITKRKNKSLDFSGFIIAEAGNASVAYFLLEIQTLGQLFESAGLKNINLKDVYFTCFATEGFQVENVRVFGDLVIANFNINLICVNTKVTIDELQTETGEAILTEAEEGVIV
jgi:hypothetical protein